MSETRNPAAWGDVQAGDTPLGQALPAGIPPGRRNRKGAVVRLTRADGEQVETLRRGAYDPTLLHDPAVLRWDGNDGRALVLGVRGAGGELLATMRGVTAEGADEVQSLIDGVLPSGVLAAGGRAMILQRAATAADVRAGGLNALLRLHFLRAAIANGADFLLGEVIAGSARTGTMRRLGYEFVPYCHNQRGPFAAGAAFQLAVLCLRTHAVHAARELDVICGPLAAEYPPASDLSAVLPRDGPRHV